MGTQLKNNLKELQSNVSKKNLARVVKRARQSGQTKLNKAFVISFAKYETALDRLAAE